jgi:hypothetical protein
MQELSDGVAEQMLMDSAVLTAIGAEVERLADTGPAETFANAFLDAAARGGTPKPLSALRAVKRLISPEATATSYEICLNRANEIFDAAMPNAEIALTAAIAMASPHSAIADWDGWAARIKDGGRPQKYVAAQAAATLVAIFTRHAETDAPQAIERIAPLLAELAVADPAATTGVVPAITAAMSARNYWTDSSLRTDHVAVTKGALAAAAAGLATTEIGAAVDADLARGYGRVLTVDTVETYEELADVLPSEVAKTISAALAPLTVTDPVEDAIRVRARISLVRRIKAAGEDIWTVGPAGVSRSQVEEAMAGAGTVRDQLPVAWLDLDPPVGEVAKLVNDLGTSANRVIGSGVTSWASRHSPDERSELSVAVLTVDAPSWMPDLLSQDMPEEPIMTELAARIQRGSKVEDRRAFARMIESAGPTDEGSLSRVAALVTWLLSQSKGGDDRTALDLMRVLPKSPQTVRALQKPIVDSIARGIDLRRSDRDLIENLGIRIPKKHWGLFGR